MRAATRRIATGSTVLAGALASIVAASPDLVRADPLSLVSAPATYRSWSLESGVGRTKLSQLYVPLTARVDLNGRTRLVLSTAAGASRLEPPGGSGSSLNGAAALALQAFTRVLGDRVQLQAGLTLPSGRRTLDGGDLAVSQALAVPVLGFGLKQYGRGLEWGGGASFATPISPTAVASAGIGGVVRESYDLGRGLEDYRPASEWALTGGVDFGAEAGEGAARPMRLDVTFRSFGKDEVGGNAVFEEGSQVELQARDRRGSDGLRTDASVQAVIKSDNTSLGAGGSTVARIKLNSGSAVFARIAVTRPTGSGTRVGLEGEWDHVGGSDVFGRDGNAFGLGPVVELPLGGGASARLAASYLRGRLPGPAREGDITLRGFSLSVGLRWTPVE